MEICFLRYATNMAPAGSGFDFLRAAPYLRRRARPSVSKTACPKGLGSILPGSPPHAAGVVWPSRLSRRATEQEHAHGATAICVMALVLGTHRSRSKSGRSTSGTTQAIRSATVSATIRTVLDRGSPGIGPGTARDATRPIAPYLKLLRGWVGQWPVVFPDAGFGDWRQFFLGIQPRYTGDGRQADVSNDRDRCGCPSPPPASASVGTQRRPARRSAGQAVGQPAGSRGPCFLLVAKVVGARDNKD